MHRSKCSGAFQIQEISIKWSQPLWPASVSNKRIKVNADKMARCPYGNEPKWRESSASRAQSYRWNTLTDDALIEQSSSKSSSYRDRFWSGTRCERRHESRREVVWTLWKMAAAPYQAQWPLRQIVYFARGGGVSGIDAPRRIFGAVRTRLYGLCVIHVARVT